MIAVSPALRRLVVAAILALIASCRPTPGPTAPISIGKAWARETAPGQTGGAAYLTIVNSGSGDDRLLSVTSPRSAGAILHSSINEGGITGMRMMSTLEIPAGHSVTLAPLGSHIMLTGVSMPLKPGERLPLSLRFAHAGTHHVDALVVPAGATGPRS